MVGHLAILWMGQQLLVSECATLSSVQSRIAIYMDVCQCHFVLIMHGESSQSLEGRDRVRCCHLLTSFEEGSHQNCSFKDFIQKSASKMANCIIVDIVNSMLLMANS